VLEQGQEQRLEGVEGALPSVPFAFVRPVPAGSAQPGTAERMAPGPGLEQKQRLGWRSWKAHWCSLVSCRCIRSGSIGQRGLPSPAFEHTFAHSAVPHCMVPPKFPM
jgi:hypothetical protein